MSLAYGTIQDAEGISCDDTVPHFKRARLTAPTPAPPAPPSLTRLPRQTNHDFAPFERVLPLQKNYDLAPFDLITMKISPVTGCHSHSHAVRMSTIEKVQTLKKI